jgi:hypothetical protein
MTSSSPAAFSPGWIAERSSLCVALSAPARQPSPMPAWIISWLAMAVRMPGNAISAVLTR